jgi:hypothetical protein
MSSNIYTKSVGAEFSDTNGSCIEGFNYYFLKTSLQLPFFSLIFYSTDFHSNSTFVLCDNAVHSLI